MASINTYELDLSINPEDKVIGTDGTLGADAGKTKNFTVASLQSYINTNIPIPPLQSVITSGNTYISGQKSWYWNPAKFEHTDGDTGTGFHISGNEGFVLTNDAGFVTGRSSLGISQVQVGNGSLYKTTILGTNATLNRTINLPNSSGTFALLSDLSGLALWNSEAGTGINYVAGNVGIGTVSGSSALTVSGEISSTNIQTANLLVEGNSTIEGALSAGSVTASTVTATTLSGNLVGAIDTTTTGTTQPSTTDNDLIATTAFVQDLLGDIVSGLQFQELWNATTDIPDLSAATPSNGDFWIVKVAGNTNLSGITSWAVGDWAIYIVPAGGGAAFWQKVDNTTSMSGTGTGNQVTKWSGSGASTTLTDSIITDNGTSVGVGELNPAAKLHVNGSALIANTLTVDDDATFNSDVNVGTTNIIGGSISITSNSLNKLHIVDTNVIEVLGDGGVNLKSSDGLTLSVSDFFEFKGSTGITVYNGSSLRASLSVSQITNSRTYEFPDDSGTLALFTDIPSGLISVPQNRIPFGNSAGDGLDSTSDLSYNDTDKKITIINGASGDTSVSKDYIRVQPNASLGVTMTTRNSNPEIQFKRGLAASINLHAPTVTGNRDVVLQDISGTIALLSDITNSGAVNGFQTVAVSGQSNIVADSTTDTLNLAAGAGIQLTTNASTDTVTIASTASASVTEAFKTISVSGQSDVVADGATDTLTLVAGNNMLITTSAGGDTITFASSGGGGGGGGSIDGIGTAGYITKWQDSDTLNNSYLFQLTNRIGLGTTEPTAQFHTTESILVHDVLGVGIGPNSYVSGDAQIEGALSSIAVGREVLASNVGGLYNTAIGHRSMTSTTGVVNNAFVASYNVAVGSWTLEDNVLGKLNTAVGYSSLRRNIGSMTGGFGNSGFGSNSLHNNLTGRQNTAIGEEAMRYSTDGDENVALGTSAGQHHSYIDNSNTEPLYNVSQGVFLGGNSSALADNSVNEIVIGYEAKGLGSNTAVLGNSSITKTRLQGYVGIGIDAPTAQIHTTENILVHNVMNVGIGSNGYAIGDAGYDFVQNNVAVGREVLDSNLYGRFNVAIGYKAMNSTLGELNQISPGGGNVAIGALTLEDNVQGRNNVAIGFRSMQKNIGSSTGGMDNVAAGFNSLNRNETGRQNSGFGDSVLYYNRDGDSNVALGTSAGSFHSYIDSSNTDPLDNVSEGVFLGGNSSALVNNSVNEIAIGYEARGLGSNTAVLGNTNITKTRLQGSVGIGTDDPDSSLEVAAGDVEVSTVAKGFILKSPDGTRFRIAVANDGTLSASAV